MSDLAIETHALHKHYGDVHAVDGLDMNVPRGAVYGFLGRNGAGKTTTIRMLAGLAHPSRGQMRVLGLDPRADQTLDEALGQGEAKVRAAGLDPGQARAGEGRFQTAADGFDLGKLGHGHA